MSTKTAPALVLRFGGAPRRVPLSEQPITLGRSEHCDVHLPSDEVSREHAHVWVDEAGHVVVADRKSKNGTRVDGGEPFRNAVRFAAHSIRIGEFELEVAGATPAGDGRGGVR